MGAVGGTVWHAIKGARNSPKVSLIDPGSPYLCMLSDVLRIESHLKLGRPVNRLDCRRESSSTRRGRKRELRLPLQLVYYEKPYRRFFCSLGSGAGCSRHLIVL
jgi:hypothetical protein